MTDAEFNAITERVRMFRPILEGYRNDEQRLAEVVSNFEELVSQTEEYERLVTQYNYNKPRFNLVSRSVFRLGVDYNSFLSGFNLNFSIDNAAGVQLDIIGRLIGLSRLLDYKPPTGSREMDDNEYRLALKLTVAKNTWDGTLGSISGIYSDVLGQDVTISIVDNQDMSVDVNVYSGITSREANIMENAGLILVPVGVGKNFNFIGGDKNLTLYSGVGISSLECVNYVIAR